MKKTTLTRTLIVPVVMAVLGIAAVGLLGTLQGRADRARTAQIRIAEITASLQQLGALPHLQGVGPAEAELGIKAARADIAGQLKALGQQADPPTALAAATTAIRANDPKVDEVFSLARRGQGHTPDGVTATRQQLDRQTAAIDSLQKASADYADRAHFARSQATQGIVFTVLLLLSVFAFFYTRSVFDHRTVRRLFAENERLLEASRDEAHTDVLTGLANRRALQMDLESLLPDATDEERVLLALFDLDGFKGYNDTFGHAAGDELLARLGRNLQRAVADHGATAYRLGGDEFCVLSQIETDQSEELIAAATLALTDEGDGWSIGTSVGTVWVPGDAGDVETALVMADERMY
ncbi:MAG: GGDEF domain-containing protein, partial [Patulibacter sp.]|nr:GGDEF domain-containing protein [Patulibacter sp.]